ncbi:MAG: efflux transporter outer membrane subunit [Caulobacteraceae bacterium]|nr:efflux transporter outer membrane subunit [Caulobacteraceae bacterium]
MSRTHIAAVSLAALLAAGCTLAPRYERPIAPIAQAWPGGAAGSQAAAQAAADIGWREFFTDAKLRGLIEIALRDNRDLRVATANIAQARAQYRIVRAPLLPAVNASVSQSQGRSPSPLTGQVDYSRSYQGQVAASAYELDLFGRVRSLSNEALEKYLATEEGRRNVQISLVSEVANAYLNLGADQARLQLAQNTLDAQQKSLDLVTRRFQLGTASKLDVRQAETTVEQARSDLAGYTAQVAEDQNALTLLLGAPLPDDLRPAGLPDAAAELVDVPAGLPSEVLTRRPDVLAAEHQLKAANADIGAARAAFLPRITLTGSAGSVSPKLSDLFSGGTGVWSFTPQISLPIFQGGANLAGLRYSQASRDVAVAQYEKAVQTAFREVADALAERGSIATRLGAQTALAASTADTLRLSEARYTRGVDNYLTVLVSQNAYYAAQQSLISARLAEASNRVALYKVLGGGWRETSGQATAG